MKTSGDLGFNGMTNGNAGGYNKKYQHSVAGQTMKGNYGIGPRKGNTGTPGPTTPALGSQSRSLRGGGTTVPECYESINVGRGPTKGNQAK